jgi:signal transduction histidine kinase
VAHSASPSSTTGAFVHRLAARFARAGSPRALTTRADRGRAHVPRRWVALVLITRALAAATAVALLAAHHVTNDDGTLIIVVIAYAALTTALTARFPRVAVNPAAWLIDIAVPLALIAISGDWRSPFYLLSLTTLAAPAAALGLKGGVLTGFAYAIAYAVLAHAMGPDPFIRGSQTTVETLATHLVLPVLGTFGIGYASDTLARLHEEQRRSQRLAINAERRRIAWELHDSAKQRIHAANLVLSAVTTEEDTPVARAVRQALGEMRAAAADMDTSLAELRSPLQGRRLDEALRDRAGELAVANGPSISVTGTTPALQPLQAAHAYRIAAEAMTNAVRHADASRIDVHLDGEGPDRASLVVADDGSGMPATVRPGSTGLLAMRDRARTIEGDLTLLPGTGGHGTVVTLRFPTIRATEASG